MTQPLASPRVTPLHAWHKGHGARMVSVAGWELAGEFAGAVAEHRAVRTSAGVSDLGWRGQIEVAGVDALATLQWVASNDAGRLARGESHVSILTTEAGTCIASVRVCRIATAHFLLIADDAARVRVRLQEEAPRFGDVAVVDTSARYAMVAVQGPASERVLQSLTTTDLPGLESGWIAHGEVAGKRATIVRGGSTGEDGFEILTPSQVVGAVWDALLSAGADEGVVPVGRTAVEALRIEAAVPVAGAELDETTSLLEAGLDGCIAWDKGDFSGRAVLLEQHGLGSARRLVGVVGEGAEPMPHGAGVYRGGCQVGYVTSSAGAPIFDRVMGMAYVPTASAEVGTEFDVDVCGRRAGIRVVPVPFHKRPKG